jgi:hypothetical protein
MDEATSPQATDVIRLRVTDNPKRVGSKSWLRFALYADRMTVGQYIDAVQNQFGDVEAGRCLQDLQWDSDPNRAFICIERNGKAITLRRTPSMSYGRTRAPGPSRKFSPPGLGYTRTAASLPPWSQSNSSVKLDDGLLASYCENFFGYGNFASRFWFVGKQEGGGGDITDAKRRLDAWSKLGRPTLADCARFHAEIGWVEINTKVQPTWGAFIRIVHELTSNRPVQSVHPGEVLRYQRENLGRLHGDNCVIDLLPLATPRVSSEHWNWNRWSNLPWLSNATTFQRWIIPIRIARIRTKLQKLDTVRVIFFGTQRPFPYWWQQICEVELTPAWESRIGTKIPPIRPCLPAAAGTKSFWFCRIQTLTSLVTV